MNKEANRTRLSEGFSHNVAHPPVVACLSWLIWSGKRPDPIYLAFRQRVPEVAGIAHLWRVMPATQEPTLKKTKKKHKSGNGIRKK